MRELPPDSVIRGARDPERYELEVDVPSTLDGTDVESVELLVARDDGTEVTWACTILSATTSLVIVEHVFAPDGSDVPTVEELVIRPRVTFAGGDVRRCIAVPLHVIDDVPVGD